MTALLFQKHTHAEYTCVNYCNITRFDCLNNLNYYLHYKIINPLFQYIPYHDYITLHTFYLCISVASLQQWCNMIKKKIMI